jgi:hypothetical protein
MAVSNYFGVPSLRSRRATGATLQAAFSNRPPAFSLRLARA